MNSSKLAPFSLSTPRDHEEVIQSAPQNALNNLTHAVAGFIGQNVAYLIIPKNK